MSRRDVRPTLTPWTTPKGRRRDVDDIESRTGPVLALGSKHSHAGTQGEPCSRCLYMQGWWRCSFWLLFSPEMMLIYTLNQRNPQGIADCPCTLAHRGFVLPPHHATGILRAVPKCRTGGLQGAFYFAVGSATKPSAPSSPTTHRDKERLNNPLASLVTLEPYGNPHRPPKALSSYCSGRTIYQQPSPGQSDSRKVPPAPCPPPLAIMPPPLTVSLHQASRS